MTKRIINLDFCFGFRVCFNGFWTKSFGPTVVGYAMNENDWSCLHDVYESLFISENGAGQRASYVLQTYWRDMTSGFEFAGPYFLREVPLDGKFLHDIVFKVISTLEKYRFHVILLVGDGASCNLALFKRLCGYANEQLPVEDTGAERYQFKASFINPFSTRSDKTCFVMICPAHQVRYYNNSSI